MSMVLISIRWPGKPPTLEEVEKRFRLDPGRVDEAFGLVEIDPDQHLFSLRLEAEEADKMAKGSGPEVEGPFSDPQIDTFGPPQS